MWQLLATLLTSLIQSILDRLDHKRSIQDATRLELERDATAAELETTRRTSAANAAHRSRDTVADRLRDGTF